MANYAGLSYGNEVYCGADVYSIMDTGSGTITGTGKCFQVYNSVTGGTLTVTVNGNTIEVPPSGTVDVVINTLTGISPLPEGLCIVCTCHDCNNPDGSAQRAVSWLSGDTQPTVINPISPYTLIGMGYLNS